MIVFLIRARDNEILAFFNKLLTIQTILFCTIIDKKDYGRGVDR